MRHLARQGKIRLWLCVNLERSKNGQTLEGPKGKNTRLVGLRKCEGRVDH